MSADYANHGQTSVLVMVLMLVFAGLAVPALYVFLRHRYRDAFFSRLYDNAAWLAVPAVIESAKVERIVPTSEAGLRYTLDIRYRYECGGTSYAASTICRTLLDLGSLNGVPPKQADRLKSILPVGTQVTAYVDTLNPTTATLSIQDAVYSGKPKAAIYMMMVLAFFSLFGIASFLFGIVYLWRA